MVERTRYREGEPCWADLVTADVDGVKRFYRALFGWTYIDAGPGCGGYSLALLDGLPVAGISAPPPGEGHSPAAWSVYLATHHLDGVGQRVQEAGGKVAIGPLEVPGNGRMLFVVDPTGAGFGVWEAGRLIGSEVYGEPGAFCWAEVCTREPDAADGFYGELFGYAQERVGDGDQFDYSTWSLDGEDVCGRLKMTESWQGIPPHWTVYYAVENADAAVERAGLAGGQVQQGPFDSPHGRIAVLADPSGAVFSIIAA
jgi:predicted enzyme related to lactoylglutathione lyase